ncbi:MAG: ethanolamine ammonia-lyase subunit EutC [Lachnospiraceae bacterium]|nr:ethanolamine ammonia-lyase subunit EutC [Lachnospiraceae bacterium]
MRDHIKDITSVSTQEMMDLTGIEFPKELEKLKQSTPARIGIGHTGARYKTIPMLRFLADQAAASDAVFMEVDKGVIEKLGVFEVKTKCSNKYEMLTRPDWGRVFDEDQKQIIKERCMPNPQVQIYFGDGLCAPSIQANIPDLFPVIKMGLEYEGITVGTPFFVRYCRVNTARTIAPLLGAEVTCTLIGERPGLLTSESMSAYIAYHPRPEMLESEYTVIANISRHGIPPVEAAAHIVDLILEILKTKKSGVSLTEI